MFLFLNSVKLLKFRITEINFFSVNESFESVSKSNFCNRISSFGCLNRSALINDIHRFFVSPFSMRPLEMTISNVTMVMCQAHESEDN